MHGYLTSCEREGELSWSREPCDCRYCDGSLREPVYSPPMPVYSPADAIEDLTRLASSWRSIPAIAPDYLLGRLDAESDCADAIMRIVSKIGKF